MMADKYDAFLDAPEVSAPNTVDKYDSFLDEPVAVTQPAPVAAPRPPAVVQQPVAAPTRSAYKPGVFENASGAITEPLMKMGSSLIAKPVSEVMGISAMFADYLGGVKGDPSGFQKSMQDALTYEPRTAAGASKYNPLNAIPDAIGRGVSAVTTPVMGALRGDASADSVRGVAVNALGEAVPQALGMIGVKNAPLISKGVRNVATDTVADATKSMAFSKQAAKEAASATDWNRSQVIESAKIGRKHNWTMNPSITTPSVGATVNNAIVNGDYFNAAASINNAPKFNAATRSEFGIPKNRLLDQKAYLEAADGISAPYKALDQLTPVRPEASLLAELRKVGVSDVMGTDVASAKAVSRLASSVEKELSGKTIRSNLAPGMTSMEYPSTKTILKTISDMRLKASDALNSANRGQIPSSERAVAYARRDIANILEQHLETLAPPKLVPKMIDARTKLAQLHKFEDATNFATGQVDPMVFAAEMAGKHNITGLAAEMGTFAANMPEVVNVLARKEGAKIRLPSRSGPAGSLAYAAATAAGQSGVTGSAVGAGLASIGGKVKLKKMLSDDFQAKNTIPLDRRIPIVNNGMMQP
jgi:hypothetical protein